MAYGLKYKFRFLSEHRVDTKIEVLQDGYSGTVYDRHLGAAPILHRKKNGGICGSSLDFDVECAVDGEFAEFYTSDAYAFRVDVYRGAFLIWSGFIEPELYSEPDIAPPYDVRVTATDGLGELKMYDFEAQGTVTLGSLLTYLLSHTGRTSSIGLVTSLYSDDPAIPEEDFFDQVAMNVNYMVGSSCYDVLSHILDTLDANLILVANTWFLMRENDVDIVNIGGQNAIRYYPLGSPLVNYLYGFDKGVGQVGTADMWPIGHMSSEIVPARKTLTITAPWHTAQALNNSEMLSDFGWTKTSLVVFGAGRYDVDASGVGYVFYCCASNENASISQSISCPYGLQDMTLKYKIRSFYNVDSLGHGYRPGSVFRVRMTYKVDGYLNLYTLDYSTENAKWVLNGGTDYETDEMPNANNSDVPGSSYGGNRYPGEISLSIPVTTQELINNSRVTDLPGTLYVSLMAYSTDTNHSHVNMAIFGASLELADEINGGYKDVISIQNGARSDGDNVEVAGGRIDQSNQKYYSFLQGVFLDSQTSIMLGKIGSDNFSAMDYMSLIGREYARGVALPRIKLTGALDFPAAMTYVPLVLHKGAIDYWVNTYDLDLLNDELKVEAVSLPAATLTVQSEKITELPNNN